MGFSIGDTVKFLNNVGGGKITKVLNKNLVEVETPDGFRMPVLPDELILIEEEIGKQNTQKQSAVAELVENEDDFDEIVAIENTGERMEVDTDNVSQNELLLAFTPTDTKNLLGCDLDSFLINDTDYYIIFNYLQNEGGKVKSLKRGTLEPNTKLMLDTVKRERLHSLETFSFQIIFYKKTAFQLKQPISVEVKINSVKFYKEKSYEENDFFDEPAVIYKIAEDNKMKEVINSLTANELSKIASEKEKNNKPKTIIKTTNPTSQEEVVDLHLHELIDDETGLSPKDKLDLQMNKFREQLNSSISRKIKRIVFIHGKGNGVLKQEIKKELQTKYKQLRFQDASFQEYGWGATMVILRN